MTFNSQEIIKDIRTEFEKMLDFVTGDPARTATADHIERGLFNLLLSLGAKLLTLFFGNRLTKLRLKPTSLMKRRLSCNCSFAKTERITA